jgi:hypothetical protein
MKVIAKSSQFWVMLPGFPETAGTVFSDLVPDFFAMF